MEREREREGSIKPACSVDFCHATVIAVYFLQLALRKGSIAQRQLIILLFAIFFFYSSSNSYFLFTAAKDSFWTTVRPLVVKSPHKATVQTGRLRCSWLAGEPCCVTSPGRPLVGKRTHGHLRGPTQKSLSPLIFFFPGQEHCLEEREKSHEASFFFDHVLLCNC